MERTSIRADTVVDYLLRRGLIDGGDIVDGGLEIRDAQRRNNNVQVRLGRGSGFMIKQPFRGDRFNRTPVEREAGIYALAREDGVSALAPLLPELVLFDRQPCILVTTLLDDHVTLREWEDDGRPDLPGPFAMLGQAVATLHGAERANRPPDGGFSFDDVIPRQLTPIARPGPGVLFHASPGGVELLRMVQGHEGLFDFLREAYDGWEATALIHGDLKADNVLVPAQRAGDARVRIVDWEMAGRGDPAWDTGRIFGELLCRWLYALPMSTQAGADDIAATTAHELADFQSDALRFWSAYSAASPPSVDLAAHLDRAIHYSVCCTLQASLDSVASSSTLTPTAVHMAQVCANIVEDPDLAAIELFGLDP